MFALSRIYLKANPLFGVGLLIRSPQLYFLNLSHPMPKAWV
ncbi:hypothetical protein HPHPH1_0940 [Helicobacter pylori Hp H-1]|uniref:Uncharacterized protein n=1 Tax=Helicobacter pylori Hp H-1 TaxID=992058 RepID=M7RY68_HELPX|nr:hypothetical protein HPHPH1_0940 [Helicobacter pylori Hp H-1]